MDKKSVIEFPCQFPIKVMGVKHDDLIPEVVAIISAQVHDFNPELDIVIKPSSKGNYLSITAMINAKSQEQLDNIYRALNKHVLVKITL